MDNLEIEENGQGEEASPYMYDSAEENENKGTSRYTIFLSYTSAQQASLVTKITIHALYCRKRRRKT